MKRSRGRPKQEQTLFENKNDLAHYLKIDRRTLNRWLDRSKGMADPMPPKKGDRWDGPAIKQWAQRNNLKSEPDSNDQSDSGRKAFWDAKCAELKFERDSFAFEIEKRNYVSIAEFTASYGQMLAGFRTALNVLPGSAARWLIGLKDFHAIKNKLQSEVDGVLQALGRCHYLEELAPAVIEKHFAEHDADFRAALLHATSRCFAELGRLALEDLLQRELPPEVPQTSKSSEAGTPKSESDQASDIQPETTSLDSAKRTRRRNE